MFSSQELNLLELACTSTSCTSYRYANMLAWILTGLFGTLSMARTITLPKVPFGVFHSGFSHICPKRADHAGRMTEVSREFPA